MGNSGTGKGFSIIHNDLVFIVYGAILRSCVEAIGYSTVEQPMPIWKIDVKSIYIMDFHDASIEIEQETIKNEL